MIRSLSFLSLAALLAAGCPPDDDDSAGDDDSSPAVDDDDSADDDDDSADDDDDATSGDDDDDSADDDDDDSAGDDDDDSAGDDDDDSAGPSGDPLQVCSSGPTDPFWLGSAALTGDLLTLEVSSSGGCEDHDWFVCWDGLFMESFPVQADLTIFHDAHNDPCDAIVTETLWIDLVPLRDAWILAYGSAPGEVVIHVDSATLNYVF